MNWELVGWIIVGLAYGGVLSAAIYIWKDS